MIGSKTDGIPKVVDGKTGHDGVQVDDAKALAGVLVHQDIVQFGVVVGHPQGDFSLPHGGKGHRAVRLPLEAEVDFPLAVLYPAQLVRCHGFL